MGVGLSLYIVLLLLLTLDGTYVCVYIKIVVSLCMHTSSPSPDRPTLMAQTLSGDMTLFSQI